LILLRDGTGTLLEEIMKGLFITIGLAALVGTGISAQENAPKPVAEKVEATKPEAVQAAAPQQITTFNKASTFIGSAVQSAEGKAIGKVQDLVFDLERGELAYAVVALNGANGATRQVAVPTRALKPAEGHLVLNMSEAVLAAAEGMQEGDWPGTDVFAVGGPAQAESGGASSESSQKSIPETKDQNE
jgi:sporulation protein YlmC with PRC-barrel domain